MKLLPIYEFDTDISSSDGILDGILVAIVSQNTPPTVNVLSKNWE